MDGGKDREVDIPIRIWFLLTDVIESVERYLIVLCAESCKESVCLSVWAGLSDFGETTRETVTAEEGGAAHIECRLPKSNPPALPRYRVQGKWLEHSTGRIQRRRDRSSIVKLLDLQES